MITISFNTEEEKNLLIETYIKNGYILKEVQYLFTGNNLIFDISTNVVQLVVQLEEENEALRESQLSQDELIMTLILGDE